MSTSFEELLAIQPSGDDSFVISPPGTGFLFGGLSTAMSLRAAIETVDRDTSPLSIHVTFIGSGDWGGPHLFRVARVADTRAFCMRRVEMFTGDKLAVTAEVVFHRPEAGEDWQILPPPDAPAPETLAWRDNMLPGSVMDLRPVYARPADRDKLHPYWCRPTVAPTDPVHLACALAFTSDYAVVRNCFPTGSGLGEQHLTRTLSHALFFHRPLQPGAWQYFDCTALSVAAGRFISRGTVQDPDGTLVASFAQQGVIRPLRGDRPPIGG